MSDPDVVAAEARYTRLSELPFVSYKSQGNAVSGFFSSLKDVLGRRELLGQLVRRELVGKYKDSALGLVWSLVRPLTQLFIYYLVIGKFLGAARGIDNFAVFIFCGLTIYGLFSETVTSMTSSVVSNSGLIKKVHLPREVFPLAAAGASLFNFAIQLIILLIAALLIGTISVGTNLLFAFAAFFVIMVWALALGLTLSAANVFMRDIQFLTDVVMMLLMWFSPILYSWTFVRETFGDMGLDWLTSIYMANPITIAVIGFQEAFWAIPSGGELLPDLWLRMLIAGLVGLVALWAAQRYFARRQANFAQEL
ncbi:MAG: ABC transporter permease [Scrofimicrobium sp.]